MPRTELEQKIHYAFRNVPFPADGYDIYAAQRDDDYGNPSFTTEHLPGRCWHELAPEQLLDCPAAFSYLRPDGWRHYLPAALLLELRQPHSNIDVIWILRESDPTNQEGRHQLLSIAQINAVIAFLEHYIKRERNIHAAHAHHRYAKSGVEWTEALEPAELENAKAALAYWQQRKESR